LQRRSELQSLIGEYAEKLVFVHCFAKRASLDAQMLNPVGPYRLIHRETGEAITLSKNEFDDIAQIHLSDHLEQVERSQQWSYRTNEYQAIAERLGGIVLQAYHQVFGEEPELIEPIVA
jgi:cytosine/adenosine deaminase-related metal-dependent hydrolase